MGKGESMDDVLTQEERNRYMREWSFYLSSMIGKIKSDEMLLEIFREGRT